MTARAPDVLINAVDRQIRMLGFTNMKARRATDLRVTYLKGVLDACLLLGIATGDTVSKVEFLAAIGRSDEALRLLTNLIVEEEGKK
jgi:hypothetical protein